MKDELTGNKPLSEQFDDAMSDLLDDPRWHGLKVYEIIGLMERQTHVLKNRLCGYRQERRDESP